MCLMNLYILNSVVNRSKPMVINIVNQSIALLFEVNARKLNEKIIYTIDQIVNQHLALTESGTQSYFWSFSYASSC